MRDRLLDRYGLGAAFDGQARQVGSSLDVGGDCDDVKRLAAQHFGGVGIESVRAVPFAERLETPGVALRSGHEFDTRPIMEDLGPSVRYVRTADVLVIVKLAVNIKLRRRALNVVD